MNELLGLNNWLCFPNTASELGVKTLPKNFEIKSPVQSVHTDQGEYGPGQVPPTIREATIKLEKELPHTECPPIQKEEIATWKRKDAIGQPELNQTRFDELFGQGNWQCTDENFWAIKVNPLVSHKAVEYPFIAIDTITKYGVGEVARGGGGATVWFAEPVPRDQCPDSR